MTKLVAELEREILACAGASSTGRRRGGLTGQMALEMPRFDFIARWLMAVTRKKVNRGPLGLRVRRIGGEWQIVSPVGGGTVQYRTRDPALLFDYARRTQLGRDVRDADDFRGLAYADRDARAVRGGAP